MLDQLLTSFVVMDDGFELSLPCIDIDLHWWSVIYSSINLYWIFSRVFYFIFHVTRNMFNLSIAFSLMCASMWHVSPTNSWVLFIILLHVLTISWLYLNLMILRIFFCICCIYCVSIRLQTVHLPVIILRSRILRIVFFYWLERKCLNFVKYTKT